jgi:hypothetical protein
MDYRLRSIGVYGIRTVLHRLPQVLGMLLAQDGTVEHIQAGKELIPAQLALGSTVLLVVSMESIKVLALLLESHTRCHSVFMATMLFTVVYSLVSTLAPVLT